MALNDGDWNLGRGLTAVATGGLSEVLGIGEASSTPNYGSIKDMSQPGYTGNAANWEFMGGDSGVFGSDNYRNQYDTGAANAGNRQTPIAIAAQIDQQQQDQFRQQQMQALASLQQRASGQGPTSLAEQSALDQGETGKRLATAQALSARGMSGGAAQRAAQEAQARQGISAQQQQGLVRQQEQAQAQQFLGQLSGQVRGQDIGLAGAQAGLNQQTSLANQQAGLEQQGLNDQLTQFYTNMGLSLEEAKLQADIARQQMLSDIVQSQYNAQAGVITSGLADASSKDAARAAALGTVAYGAASGYGKAND